MTDSELANYVLADPPMITALVKAWLSTDSSFRTFVQRNANKIRSKFRKASEVEDCHDVLAELEFARAILTDARFEIEYEPDIRSGLRNPDFLVKASHAGNFNLEVKRVRPSEATRRVREFQQVVLQGIRSVPSSLGVSLDILPASGATAFELTGRLPASASRVVSQIVETIPKTEGTLGKEDTVSFHPEGFEDEIKVTIFPADRLCNAITTCNAFD